MIKWVATVWFPIASVRRLTIQSNNVVSAQATQFRPRRARNTDRPLLHEPQDGPRADDGAQLLGQRVRMYVRFCRRQGLRPLPCQDWRSVAGRESCSERTASMLSASNTTLYHAKTEETTLEKMPKYSSANMAASEVENRLVKGR